MQVYQEHYAPDTPALPSAHTLTVSLVQWEELMTFVGGLKQGGLVVSWIRPREGACVPLGSEFIREALVGESARP